MKIRSPLLSVLVLGSMSVLGLNEHPPYEIVHEAVCKIRCQDSFVLDSEKCWQLCNSEPREIRVLDAGAEVSDKLVCISPSNQPALVPLSHFYRNVFIEEIRNQTSDLDDTTATFTDLTLPFWDRGKLPPGRYELRYTRVFAEGISKSEIKGFIVPEPGGKLTENLDFWVQCVKHDGDSSRGFTVEIGVKPVVENPYCMYFLICEEDDGDYRSGDVMSFMDMTQKFVKFKNLPMVANFTVRYISTEDDVSSDPFVRTLLNDDFKFSTPSIQRFRATNATCVPNEIENLDAVITHKQSHTYDVQVTWGEPYYTPEFFILNITSNTQEFDESPVSSHNVSGRATQTIFRDVYISQHFNVSIRGWSAFGEGPVTAKSFTVPDVSGSDTDSDTIIITAALASSTLVSVTGVCIYLILRRRRRRQRGRNKEEIDPDRLTMTRVLGSGAFGVVKFGRLREDNGQVIDVAVKMLRDDTNKTELRNFRSEIEMMKSLGEHPNVVSFLGYRTTGLYPFLVVEYCPRGDLLSFLRGASLETKTATAVDENDERYVTMPGSPTFGQDTIQEENADGSSATTNEDAYIDTADANQDANTVTVLNMLNFGRQIATGMEFLSLKRIIHRDLAARNVLVCDKGIVKISDFGMSRDIYRENMYRKTGNGRMPFKWMAIEALIHQVFTTQSDVWSFGILLWEIFTLGHTPYLDIPTLEILRRLQSGYRMERPDICSDALYNVMLSCWEARPQNRPTFTVLRKQLDRLIRATAEHEYLDADYISFWMTLEGDSEPSSHRDTSPPLEMSSAHAIELSIVHESSEPPEDKAESDLEAGNE